MEAAQLTSKVLRKTLYGTPKTIRAAKKQLEQIHKLAVSVLPSGNDLPHSARGLNALLSQVKELLPNRFFIFARYSFRPQSKMIRRVQLNSVEISKIYYEYFIRQGNSDLRLIEKDHPDVHAKLVRLIDEVRLNIDDLLGLSELVGELKDRNGVYKGYVSDRGFKIWTIIITAAVGFAFGIASTLVAQYFKGF